MSRKSFVVNLICNAIIYASKILKYGTISIDQRNLFPLCLQFFHPHLVHFMFFKDFVFRYFDKFLHLGTFFISNMRKDIKLSC